MVRAARTWTVRGALSVAPCRCGRGWRASLSAAGRRRRSVRAVNAHPPTRASPGAAPALIRNVLFGVRHIVPSQQVTSSSPACAPSLDLSKGSQGVQKEASEDNGADSARRERQDGLGWRRKEGERGMGGCSDSATDLCLSVYTVIQGFAELTLPPTALPSHHHRPHRPSSPSPPVLPPSLPRAYPAPLRPPDDLSAIPRPLRSPGKIPVRASSPQAPRPEPIPRSPPFLSTRHRPFWRTSPTSPPCSLTTSSASLVFRSHSLNPGLSRACPIWVWTRGCGSNSNSLPSSSERNSRQMVVRSLSRWVQPFPLCRCVSHPSFFRAITPRPSHPHPTPSASLGIHISCTTRCGCALPPSIASSTALI